MNVSLSSFSLRFFFFVLSSLLLSDGSLSSSSRRARPREKVKSPSPEDGMDQKDKSWDERGFFVQSFFFPYRRLMLTNCQNWHSTTKTQYTIIIAASVVVSRTLFGSLIGNRFTKLLIECNIAGWRIILLYEAQVIEYFFPWETKTTMMRESSKK